MARSCAGAAVVAVGGVALLLSTAAAAAAEPVTLDEVLALAHDQPAADEAAAEVAVAEARLSAVRAARLPRVGAEVRVGASPGSLVRLPDLDAYVSAYEPLDKLSIQGRYGLAINVEQIVSDFGQSRARLGAARRLREAAVLEGEVARAELDQAVAAAYFGWAAAAAIADAAAADVAAAQAATAEMRALVAAGRRAGVELDALVAEELRAGLAERRADGERVEAQAVVEAMVGALPVGAVPAEVEGGGGAAAAVAVAVDVEDAALQARVEAARDEVTAQERAGRPVLSVELTLGVGGIDDRLFPAWEGVVALRVPLWDRGLDAAATEARAEARRLSARRHRLARERAAEERAVGAGLVVAEEREALAAALVRQCEALLASAEAGEPVDGGGGAVSEAVLEARAALRRARLEERLAGIDAAAARFRNGER